MLKLYMIWKACFSIQVLSDIVDPVLFDLIVKKGLILVSFESFESQIKQVNNRLYSLNLIVLID